MKSSLESAPAGERPPRVRVVSSEPCWWEENAEDMRDFCAAYVNPLHDWQDDVLACWIAEDDDGRYVHQTCGLLVPRQNGKTEDIEGRIAYGLLFANGGQGEIIAYSAHRVDSTLVMFERLLDLFGDNRKPPEDWKHPELHDLVASEVFTNGHQAIELKNGAKVAFSARSTGARRAFTADVQIYDEAGFLTDDQLSASKSTVSSAPHGNPQTIYAGTPPSEHGIYAEPFSRVRSNAMARMGGTCWHEWSVEDMDPRMLSDRNVWAETNPSLGANLLWSAVESELADMSPEKFAIERLCWWPETASAQAFNPRKWEASASDGPADEEIAKTAVGVKFAPDGLQVCASIAALVRGETRSQDRVHALWRAVAGGLAPRQERQHSGGRDRREVGRRQPVRRAREGGVPEEGRPRHDVGRGGHRDHDGSQHARRGTSHALPGRDPGRFCQGVRETEDRNRWIRPRRRLVRCRVGLRGPYGSRHDAP